MAYDAVVQMSSSRQLFTDELNIVYELYMNEVKVRVNAIERNKDRFVCE